MIGRLGRRYGEHVQVQAQLAYIRMHLLHGHLTAAGAVIDIRMIRIHKVGGVLAYNTAAGLQNCMGERSCCQCWKID